MHLQLATSTKKLSIKNADIAVNMVMVMMTCFQWIWAVLRRRSENDMAQEQETKTTEKNIAANKRLLAAICSFLLLVA